MLDYYEMPQFTNEKSETLFFFLLFTFLAEGRYLSRITQQGKYRATT